MIADNGVAFAVSLCAALIGWAALLRWVVNRGVLTRCNIGV